MTEIAPSGGGLVAYAYWLLVAAAMASIHWLPWMTLGAIAGFSYSLRLAYLMGECAGLNYTSGRK